VSSTSRGMGRGLALYALACVLAIGLAGAVFAVIYDAPAERQAVLLSAVVALVVQLIAFAFARLLADRGNAIAGWAAGAAVCFTALISFGFVSRALGVPQNAALLSLATFFFLTELIEPPLLSV
jgi:heme/copper-type cytochrome/quinol oxidase subunit 4